MNESIHTQHNGSLKRRTGSLKIAEDLRRAISSGDVKPGTAITSERKLAELYKVNHTTARKATQLLVDEGLLEKKPGIGVFVKYKSDIKKIGICVPTLSISIYSDMVEIAEELVLENGGEFHLIRRDDEKDIPGRIAKVEKYLKITPLDALIFTAEPPEGQIEAVKRLCPGIHIAVVSADLSKEGIDSVYSDDESGAYLATEHLIKQKKQRILHITALQTFFTAKSRFKGYKSAMKKWDLKPWYIISEFSYSEGLKTINKVITEGNIPDAVFAVTDLCAMGVIKGLRDHGIKVPQEIPVVGFSNLREAQFHTPSISTVDTNVKEMTRIVVKQILAKLSGNSNELLSCVVPVHLVIRESSRFES